MTEAVKEKARLAWRRAIFNITAASPFFSTIILGLPHICTDQCEIAATDGKSIFYNPEGLLKVSPSLSEKEIAYVAIHESLHIALGHCWRGMQHLYPPGGRRPHETKEYLNWLSNVACDIIVNDIIESSNISNYVTRPKLAILCPEAIREGGPTVEQVFLWLRDHKSRIGKEIWTLDIGDGTATGKTEAEIEAAKTRAAELVAAATQAAQRKGCGDLPAGLRRLVGEVLDPKLDWRTLLRGIASEVVSRVSDISWERPNRRMLWSGVYLPSQQTEYAIGRLSVGIDCSGSISDSELRAFLSELYGLWNETPPATLDFLWFDAAVSSIQTFSYGDVLEPEPAGGGGTAFPPVIAAASNLTPPPDALVMLTDLECSDFGPPPPYPVLWVVTGSIGLTAPSQTDLQARVPYGRIAALLDIGR